MARRHVRWLLLALLGALVAIGAAVMVFVPELPEVLFHGEARRLREREGTRRAASRRRPGLLVLALDGVDRALLYTMLRRGELPSLARLLGGRDAQGGFPHAHFDERLLATMPSSTIPGWATAFTGVPPAQHGVTGNEFFIRESRRMAAPAPVSFADPNPVLATYSDDYADALLPVRTVYEQLRAREPGVRIWVSMSQFHRGADRLLMARRGVLAEAFRVFLEGRIGDDDGRTIYGSLDREGLDTVTDAVREPGPVADVLTVYLAGVDLYTHHARQDPDEARRAYLREVLDPELAGLVEALEGRGELDNRYVVVVSDHGHTQVLADAAHALGTDAPGEPPDVLRTAGFRVRPFALEVDDGHDFQAVLAYGGATAFVYLADRAACPAAGQRCDFTRPPRYEEDVLAAAEAFFAADRGDGPMRGTLERVLVRRPRPHEEDDEAFQVYLGGGRVEPLSAHPCDAEVAAAQRLADLAVGPRGERAGDVLLLARSGAEQDLHARYYFSSTYHSWHGSLGRKDSEVPLVIAHRGRRTEALRALADEVLREEHPRLQAITPLILRLRLGE